MKSIILLLFLFSFTITGVSAQLQTYELLDCNHLEGRHSEGEEPSEIIIRNHSGGTVSVYWIDYEGNERLYFKLKENQIFLQSTYVGHIWVLKDDISHCKEAYLIKSDDKVEIELKELLTN